LDSTWTLALTVVMSGYGSGIGKSNPLNLTLVGTGSPPNLVSLQRFNLIPAPEPSTFALAGLGTAVLLIFRPRE
jgi:hypothetical protein